MHRFRRIIASVLAAAMLMSELPTAALAQMPEETATETVLEESTVPASEITESAAATEATSFASVPEEETTAPETQAVEASQATEETLTEAETQATEETLGETQATEETLDRSPEIQGELVEGPVVGEDVVEGETPAEDALTWSYDEDLSMLTVSGTGDMADSTRWQEYKEFAQVLLIEEGVTSISAEAFADFSCLNLIMLPNSLTAIGQGAFRSCTNLYDQMIPAGVTSIGSEAFSGCSNLGYLQILGYDVTIGENAFAGVTADVGYPYDSSWCTGGSYGGSLNWMGYARTLGYGLYGSSCWRVEESGMLQIYGVGTLPGQSGASGYPWYSLKSSISWMNVNGVDNLPQYALSGYENLNEIRLHFLDSVDAGAFSGCSKLSSIFFTGVCDIAPDAFSGVTANVNFRETDGWQESQMLDYGGNLNWDMVYSGRYGNVNWELVADQLSFYGGGDSAVEMEDQASAEDYPWYAHKDRIRRVFMSSTGLGSYAFDGYTELAELEIYGVSTIGTCAFRGCTALTNITMGSEPPQIAEDAFTGVTAAVYYNSHYNWQEENFQDYGGSLTWTSMSYGGAEVASGTHGDNATWRLDTNGNLIVVGQGEMLSMTSAEDYGWYDYRDQIQSVTISELTSVGDYAFAGYPALYRLEIGASVTSVGSHILDGSGSMDHVMFNGLVPEIAEDAFAGLSNAGILYPYAYRAQWELLEQESNSYGGTDLFWSMWLKNIAQGNLSGGHWYLLEDGTLNIDANYSGGSVVIADTVAGSAPWSAYAQQITSVRIYCDVTIGEYAFAGCTQVSAVCLNGAVTAIGENAFQGVIATVYYYEELDEALMQDYGGDLTWQLETMWLDGGEWEGIYWNVYSDGILSLYADSTMEMPSLTSAEAYPWHSCSDSITAVSYSNITSIGDYAFADCVGLESFLFDYNIHALGDYIFRNCANLSQLTFHGSAPEFSENTFYGVTATVDYPTGDSTWTEDKLCNYGGNLTWGSEAGGEEGGEDSGVIGGACGESLTWELSQYGVMTISGTGAMYEFDGAYDENGQYYSLTPWYDYRDRIATVSIKSGVTTIAGRAFADCANLSVVSIPDTLEQIGFLPFSESLWSIQVAEKNQYFAVVEDVLYSKDLSELICYPGGKTGEEFSIPESVSYIRSQAIQSDSLQKITVPESVTVVEENAFRSCLGVTEFTFEGDAPDSGGMEIFTDLTATVYYPGNNATWTEDVMQCYGGNITWEAYFTEIDQGTCGENLTWILTNEGVLRISGTGVMDDFTSGNAPWYGYADSIWKVVIQEGVTTIGSRAFMGCESITAVTIPQGVTDIGGYAFFGCYDLTEVTIPEDVVTIGQSAFEQCRSLTSVDIPAGVTTVSEEAFYNCISLTEVTIPESVTSIGVQAFAYCSSLTGVAIPAGVTSLGGGAFKGCESLTGIWVDSGNANYASDASGVLFDKEMTLLIQAPGGLSGNYAVPDSVETIQYLAFCKCSGLTGVTIPKGVVNIGVSAFNDSGLLSVTIPASVTDIGAGAFQACTELTEIRFEGDAPVLEYDVFRDVTATAAYPAGNATWTEDVLQQYGGTITWEPYITVTAEGTCGDDLVWVLDSVGTLTVSGTGDMYDYDNYMRQTEWYWYASDVSRIVLEEGVTSVGGYAFYGDFANVTQISLPDSLVSIGEHGFEDCKNVTELTFGTNLESIGDYAFIAMNLTGALTLPDSLKSLGIYAFNGCSGLTELHLGQGLESIGGFAFAGCNGLKEVTIPAGVTWIGGSAFQFCNGITHVRFEPVDCPEITGDSLGTLSALQSVYVPGENYDSYETFLANLPDTVQIQTDGYVFPVTGLQTDAVYSRTAVLSWDAHRDDAASGYIVLRDGVEIGRTEQCSYTDRTLEPEISYSYTVQAYFEEGRVTPESQAVTAETVLPEILGLSGYTEYAGIRKFADVCNHIQVTVADKGNLQPLGQQTHTLGLYFSNGEEEILIGWAQSEAPRAVTETEPYGIDWDVSLLSDGAYTLRAVLTDVDGTTAQWTETVQVDNTPPAKLLQLLATGSEQTVELSWTQAQEYDSVGYNIYRSVGSRDNFALLTRIEGRETLSYTDTTAAETEVCYYYVVAVDIFGREARSYEVVGGSRIPDTTKPRVTQLLPVSGSYLTGAAAFRMKAEDNVSVTGMKLEYSLDAGATWTEIPAVDGVYTLDTRTLADGGITVRALAYDAAGNESDGFVQSYTIDNTGPEQVTWQDHVSTSVTLTLRWNNVADEDLGGFLLEQLQADGSYKTVAESVAALGYNLQDLIPNTAYTFRVTAYDLFGNAGIPSEPYTATTGADTISPVTVQILPGSAAFAQAIDLSATVQDDYCVASASLEYSVDNLSWTQLYTQSFTDTAAVRKISARLDLTEIPEGLLYVRAVAVDHAGNVSQEPPYVQYLVDKTAPAVPANVTALGGSGYVEISWNSAADVSGYQIWRAEAEDGEYTQLAEKHTYLNYVDRSVTDGAVYYYQVAAVDSAGNVSERSQAVSAQATQDTQAPEILSVVPQDQGVLSAAYAEISVLAKDNRQLESICMEYSHDGVTYGVLAQQQDIKAYGMTLSGTVPVAAFVHGDTVYLRVTAADSAGNVCEPEVYTYTVDSQAPTVSSVTAQYTDGTVVLSWTGGDEADLAGYRIYRRNSSGTSSVVGQIASEQGRTAYTWIDEDLPVTGGTFSYQVEAVDQVGNTATGSSTESVPGENSPVVEVPDNTGPKALLCCDSVMTAGVEYLIDGSGSLDDGQIVSYAYDFGDGTTGSGKTVIHAYAQEGRYQLTLTVTDNDGKSGTFSRWITVKDPQLLGNVSVRIVDEQGAPVPNAPVYFDLGDEERQVIRGTDSQGYATFTAEVGRHTVGCVILNNQWLPVKRDLIVNAGQTTSVSMTLIRKPIVEGTFEIVQMTLEEIEAAGIDLTDPANQYYVEVQLHLEYGNVEMSTTLPGDVLTGKRRVIIDPTGRFNWDRDDDDDDPIIIRLPDNDDDDDDGSDTGDVRGWSFELIEKSKDPKLMILDIPIGVQSLKEMFDVRLHILNNSSSEFSMLDNVIRLDIPTGLSVVTDAYMANQQTVRVAEIQGQTQKTVEWIVRGDQPGEYMVGADYSGTLSQFNESLTARFEAQDPIPVYGMTGLKLLIEVAEELENGTLYYNVILENNGKVDIYKPVISTEDVLIEMKLYDAIGQLTAEGTDSASLEILKSLLGDLLPEGSTKTISSLPDVLEVDNRLIMHYMCIDQTEYTHCVMQLQDMALEYTNTFGLEDVEVLEQPLDYFRQILNTKVNPKEKADQTFGDNQGAYNRIINNGNYVYWDMANDQMEDYELSDNADEFVWDLLRGKLKDAATDNEDTEQVKAMVIDLLTTSAETVDDIKYDKQLKFLKKLRGIVDGFAMKDILGEYATSFEKALDGAYQELKERGSLYNPGYSYALETLIYEHWKEQMLEEDLKILDKAAAFVKLQKMMADEDSEDLWKSIGMSVETLKMLQSLSEQVLVDLEWVMEAQAKEDAMLICLNAMINNFTFTVHSRYEDSWDVYWCLVDMRNMLEAEGIAYVIISNLVDMVVDYGIEKLVGKGTDVVMEMVGGSGDPLTWFVIKTVNLTTTGIDLLTNTSGQQDMADNIRFAAMLSDTARSAVINARNVYKNNKTEANAARYMQLLKLLINLRAIGESQVALYGKAFETDFTLGNLPLLKAVRAKTDAEEANSWYQWRDIVEDRISRLRIQLLRNPLSTEITGREKPTVSFDYSAGQTLQSFDESYEYSLDMGKNWTPCDGGPIPVEAPAISVELWVRKTDRTNTDMTGVGSVVIYGPLTIDAAQIEVLRTPEGYRIENLDPEKNYRVTFAENALQIDQNTVLETEIPGGSSSYTCNTEQTYRYVYIRAMADKNGYASEIACLDVVSTVNLYVFATGEGSVTDCQQVWEYGAEVSVTAVPTENRIFDGWYCNGTKLSSALTYTFRIYSSMYLEARFRELEPLPGVSAPINAEDGSAAVTTNGGTEVTVTGAPENADRLVVEEILDSQVQAEVADSLSEIGQPAQILKIYLTDAERNILPLEGERLTVSRENASDFLLLCGVKAGVATILDKTPVDGLTCEGDGSDYYVLVSLHSDRSIELQTDAYELLPRQKAQLSAGFFPGNPTGTRILWSLAQGDELYATLKASGNTAVVTALAPTGSRCITVTAKAEDGSFPSTSLEILVVPHVYQLTLHAGEEDVTGGKIVFDINGDNQLLELTANVAPLDACQELLWSISGDEDVAEVTQNGLVTFLGQTGTVRITAAATDGSKMAASVTVQAVALTQNVVMAEDSITQLVGGRSAAFQAVDADTGETLTAKALTWSLAEEYAPYAAITAAGKLTTRSVAEETAIVITGAVVGNEETGVVEHAVILRPEVNYVELYHEDRMVNAETIFLDTSEATEDNLPVIALEAILHPGDAMEGVVWKSSNAGIAAVDPETGEVTVQWDARKQMCKSGTVTITATAADGSKVSGSVKLKVGIFVEKIEIEAPELELRSGQKMTMSALIYPVNPTTNGVTWSLAGEDDSNYASITSSGRLTAKTVYDDHMVTVRATAKDGAGVYADMYVKISPKVDGILTIHGDGRNVTKQTLSVDLSGSAQITLEAYTLGDYLRETVTWTSSSKTAATLEDHGDGSVTVTMLKGATTVTAKSEDGRSASVTLKAVRLTESIEIGSKTGEMTVASGKSLNLTAEVEPRNATNRKVVWSVAPKDADYATISTGGKITAAKNLQEARSITVTATAVDGGASQSVEVLLTPLATDIRLLLDGQDVNNITRVHNMADWDVLQLEAKVYPLNQADGGITWKSSNKRIASIDEDGMITCLKAGTVTITATANDGSKVKATFKLKVEKWMTELTLPDTAVIAGGKTLTMTKLEEYFVDPDATNKKLEWSMEGEGAAFATLSSKGVLKTKKVTEPKTLTVTATAMDAGGISARCEVTIYPAATRVLILTEDGQPVSGVLTLEAGQSLQLLGSSLPVNAAQCYIWKSSAVKYAQVDENGLVTALQAGRTVSISCTAADGSGKGAVVKIRLTEAQ